MTVASRNRMTCERSLSVASVAIDCGESLRVPGPRSRAEPRAREEHARRAPISLLSRSSRACGHPCFQLSSVHAEPSAIARAKYRDAGAADAAEPTSDTAPAAAADPAARARDALAPG